jgi:CdiI immunity protein
LEDTNNFIEELEDFLGGTFHQDIESPELALEEFIDETSYKGIEQTVIDCEAFLNCDLKNQEKEDIIQSNTEIYFPAIGQAPLGWLRQVVEQLKNSLERN